MSFLDEIAAKLVADGVGVVGTNIFLSSKANIPTLPALGPFLTLLETGGSAPTRTQNSARATQRVTGQLVARAATYPVARSMAKAAYDSLDGQFNVTLSGTFYLSITARQEPTDTGLDDDKRPRVTFNIDAEKQSS